MHFDDRLATVLRSGADGERAARTQFRQLLDLVGSAPGHADEALLGHALDRLGELSGAIPVAERAGMIREPVLRLRNPRLLAWLALDEPAVIQAAMASARLSEAEWLELIPALPVTARGLLRHREDLPRGAKGLLARLGVRDLVLPPTARDEPGHADDAVKPMLDAATPAENEPDTQDKVPDPRPADSGNTAGPIPEDSEIGAIMRRIEAFRRARQSAERGPLAPPLPLDEFAEDLAHRPPPSFDFTTDKDGRIDWATPGLAPMVHGLLLIAEGPAAVARPCPQSRLAMTLRQPLRAGTVVIDGAPGVTGSWRIDATPRFAMTDGDFLGYRGRLRLLQSPAPDARSPASQTAEIIRSMLHELRTPVNAIQGFAEVIQQQVFGPAPNEYRALAAAIGVDVARVQAGFDEVDRLARLEMGALSLEEGTSDLQASTAEILARLQGALRDRSAGFRFHGSANPVTVSLAEVELQQMCWRILASVAGAAAAGEILEVVLRGTGDRALLEVQLPAALEQREDLFLHGEHSGTHTVTAGMFGTGFTLRLARAEAHAAGGELSHDEERILLALPLGLADGRHGSASA